MNVNPKKERPQKGRPPLSEQDKRTNKVVFRVTKKEKEYLADMFKESIYTKESEMFRDILLNKKYKVKVLDPEKTEERLLVIHEAKSIGNNFNQLVKKLNAKNTAYFSTSEKNSVVEQIKLIQMILYKMYKATF